jgi:hypothetical protein
MENKRNIGIVNVLPIIKNILKIFLVAIILFLIFNPSLKAYDNIMVHPALTEEVVKFYNLNFPANKINDQEMNWIKQGSIEEDAGIRPLNHFYDPVHNIGLKGVELSAKNWSQNTLAQAQHSPSYYLAGFFKSPFSYATDYSWDRALYDYVKGNKERAYVALGHIIHLIEDMTVPDHTRDDAHPPVGDMGSPYESWTKRFNKNLGIAVSLKNKNYTPIILSNLNSYFDKEANYSNNNFFSKDTILDTNFLGPKISDYQFKNGLIYAVAYDENNTSYELFFIDGNNKLLKNDLDPDSVLSDYWTHLSRQAVLSGAGVINLFFQEAEKIKNDPKFTNADQSALEKLFNSVSAYFLSFFNGANQNNNGSDEVGVNNAILAALDTMSPTPSPSPISSDSSIILPPSPTSSVLPTITPPVFPSPSYSASILPIPTSTLTPIPSVIAVYGGGGSGSSQPPSSTSPSPTPTPTLPPTPTPPPPSSPEPSPSPTPSSTPEISPTPSPEPSPTPSPSPSPTPSADTTPPEKPIILTNGGENFTSTSTPIFLEGTNSEDSDKIFVNGSEDGILRASSTLWRKLIDLLTGENIFEVWAKDLAGNVSEKSSIIITLDSSAPIPSLNFTNVDFVNSKFSIEYSLGGGTEDFQNFELNLKKENEDWQDLTSQINSTSTAGTLNYTGEVDKNYTVRLRAKDTKGNISDWVEKSITLTQKPIVFSEFSWAGTKASPYDEWIELYNLTDYPVDLTGWKLYAADGSPSIVFVTGDNTDKITRNKIIEPHGYYLIERKNTGDETDKTVSNVDADWWGSFGDGLENGGENMFLINPNMPANGTVFVDNVTNYRNYSSNWFAGNASTHASMEKVVMEESGNDYRNWLTFTGSSSAQDADGNMILGTPKSENNSHNRYHQLNGTLTQDTILSASKSPYWIYDTLTVPENIKLTIEPGVVIKFSVGDGHQRIDVKGTLDVEGTSENKVVFTSLRDDEYGGDTNNDGNATEAHRGDWKYVHLFPQSKNNKINYAMFRYGGAYQSGYMNDNGSLYIENTSADIVGSTFEKAFFRGMWAKNSVVNIEDSIFKNTTSTPEQGSGYFGSLYQTGGKVKVVHSQFINNEKGIYAYGTSPDDLLSVEDSYFSQNQSPIEFYLPTDFGNSNVAENNRYNGFLTNGISDGSNAVWGGSVPIILPAASMLTSIPANSQLTVKAGTTVKFRTFDSWLLILGRLDVEGEDGNPVVFTSIKDDSVGGDTNNDGGATLPQPGDWLSVQLKNISATSTIRYAQMRYGGTHLNGMAQHALLYADNSPVEIYNSQFRDSKFANVTIAGGTAIIKDSEFSNARNTDSSGSHIGLELSTNAPIVLENSNFYNNIYGISATTSHAPAGVDVGSLIFVDNDHDTSPIGWLGIFQ